VTQNGLAERVVRKDEGGERKDQGGGRKAAGRVRLGLELAARAATQSHKCWLTTDGNRLD